jgi:carbohydrate kinase (thermoresistant glucokinase family)
MTEHVPEPCDFAYPATAKEIIKTNCPAAQLGAKGNKAQCMQKLAEGKEWCDRHDPYYRMACRLEREKEHKEQEQALVLAADIARLNNLQDVYTDEEIKAEADRRGPGKVYFLVGPMGCGKNYVGERLAKEKGCEFIDGDAFVPEAMIEKVSKFKPLGQQDIDNYVTNHLIPGVENRRQQGKELVVAQALYRAEHRLQIAQRVRNCKFIYIDAPLTTNIKRLLGRKKGIRWTLYGLFNRIFFQKQGLTETIYNG